MPSPTRTPVRPTPLDPDLLHDIAVGFASATTLWRPLVRHDTDERRPVRLLATPAYEVWVIGWTRGQRAELHDHGDAAGALVVVDGTLTEHVVGPDGVHTEELGPGARKELTIGLVHEIVNSHDDLATSIHVYSPPLCTMTRYDTDSFEPTVTELVPNELPAFDASAAGVPDHPSTRG